MNDCAVFFLFLAFLFGIMSSAVLFGVFFENNDLMVWRLKKYARMGFFVCCFSFLGHCVYMKYVAFFMCIAFLSGVIFFVALFIAFLENIDENESAARKMIRCAGISFTVCCLSFFIVIIILQDYWVM